MLASTEKDRVKDRVRGRVRGRGKGRVRGRGTGEGSTEEHKRGCTLGQGVAWVEQPF